MTIKKLIGNFGLLVSLTIISTSSLAKGELVAPPFNIQSVHSVNMFSVQVQMTHDDLAIGGAQGLSHSISMHANEWVGYESVSPWGPVDKYHGKLYSQLKNPSIPGLGYWIIASDGTTTQKFIPGSGPTFNSGGDPRYTLKDDPALGGVVMTKPDGTKVIYRTGSPYQWGSRYDMTEIRYPNGFIIKIHKADVNKISSVTSNTGFQLKYYHVRDNTPLPSHLAAATNDTSIPSNTFEWTGQTPRYIKAINNAIEYCSTALGSQANAAECSANTWPKVEYLWPAGMPRRMYVADGTFSVIEAGGKRTDYVHRPFDKATQIEGKWYPTDPGKYKLPRLIQVVNGNTGRVLQNYHYENDGTIVGESQLYTYWKPDGYAALKSSWTEDGVRLGYKASIPRYYYGALGELRNVSGGYRAIKEVVLNPDTQSPISISAWNYSARFNGYNHNLMESFYDGATGISSTYGYDSRGNVTSITAQGGTQRAQYAASCTTTNEKYCNSPEWVEDAKGNRTEFTYHTQSGEVQTVTHPANEQGLRAKVRYTYEQKYASYYTASGVKTTSPTGIWLKTEERTCMDSATNGDVCTGGDEVLTRYEYNNDNLLLTGMTVFSQKDNRTLRSCYQYDIYGNRIGEIQPNANLNACP